MIAVTYSGCEERNLTGLRVLLADELIESGKTLAGLVEMFTKKKAKDVKTVVLADKVQPQLCKVDFTGFSLHKKAFLVGFGLDLADLLRELPTIISINYEKCSVLANRLKQIDQELKYYQTQLENNAGNIIETLRQSTLASIQSLTVYTEKTFNRMADHKEDFLSSIRTFDSSQLKRSTFFKNSSAPVIELNSPSSSL